ncbi:sialidase family protein [Anaerotalea alkaliphila]|uniref:Exo-alpha-sialidase n=1 Tax=Anaerotalea alkaliphila TaxID=2662126 RepID=A0A7X5HU25_9FIRM|nr:sialidase family protein [Anaerotalea alkaliphila]NDL66654.1 exo-alpha-sialidase [Anaerotalea alkaliphila]
MSIHEIPSLFPHNHASNILPISNGDLLCVWFGGSREGKADISIQCSRLKRGSGVWEAPVVLSDDPTRSEQNPILFENAPGELWLIYTAQEGIRQESAVVRMRKSYDYGQTWTPVEPLFEEPGIFVRNPPVRLRNGDLLLPAYYCLKSESGFLGEDYSVVKISKDDGKTWEEYGIEGSRGLVHMSAVVLSDGGIKGFFRSRMADAIYTCSSKDNGRTWTKPVPTSLPNNNASIQCTKLKNGHLAMVFNNINAEQAPPKTAAPPWFDKKDIADIEAGTKSKPISVWGVIRAPLCVAISEDEGETWGHVRNLVTREGFEGEPEFSYPSIKQSEDGKLQVTFTYLRKYIRYEVVDEDWVKDPIG